MKHHRARRKNRYGTQLCALLLAAALFFCVSACAEGFFFGDIPVLLGSTPSPSPTETPPAETPGGAPLNRVYGLAFTPVDRFQPFLEEGLFNRQLIPLCYESLYTLDADFEPVPALCLHMQSEDNRVFTLRIDTERLFWDGSPLRAADVAYSFALAAEGLYAGRFAGMTMTAETWDSLLLSSPTPLYKAAALLDFPIVKEYSAAGTVPQGTGLYRLRLEKDGSFLLRNSKHPLAEETDRERIELLPVTERDNLGYWFGNGSLRKVSLDLLDPLSQGLGTSFARTDYLTSELCFIALNHNGAWMGDAELRRALALAFDRDTLCDTVYSSLIQAAALPLPPVSPDMPSGLSIPSFDLESAAALLEEAGFQDSDGDGLRERTAGKGREPLSLRFIVEAGNPYHAAVAEGYAASLRSLGIELRLDILSSLSYAAALEKGDFDLAVAQAVLAPNFDPGVFIDSGALSFGYRDAETTALLDALYETPEARRTEALAALYARIAGEAPLLPLGFRLYSLCEAYENDD